MSSCEYAEFDEAPKSARSLMLQRYYEMLSDAVTVEEAWRLHNAIIKFLSHEIYSLSKEALPEHIKRKAANDLERARAKHAATVVRLNIPDAKWDERLPTAERFMISQVPKSVRSLKLEDCLHG